jgi:2-C-methyl-D-erythritol 4-phosphate cytidylyltransferase / 2-C-methyl-D-erythritol 2,4-cyclodiphosphate synthase
MASRPRTVALIVAAGSGTRVGGEVPKQYRTVRGQPMLWHSYSALSNHPEIDGVYVAIGEGQKDLAADALAGLPPATLVNGGATRRASVLNGLEAIAASAGADQVLIHDAARPFLSNAVITRLTDALLAAPGAVPALPVVDSLARGSDVLDQSVERDNLWRIQTPQAFRFDAILAAHRDWTGEEPTDDARMLMAAGQEVRIVQGDEALAKFTFASDLRQRS